MKGEGANRVFSFETSSDDTVKIKTAGQGAQPTSNIKRQDIRKNA